MTFKNFAKVAEVGRLYTSTQCNFPVKKYPVKIPSDALWLLVVQDFVFGSFGLFGSLGQPGSAGAVCSIKESSGPKNQQVHIVLKASKSVGAKGDVPKICGFVNPLHPL